MSGNLDGAAGDTERLMAMIMALGGEVFVLKAQLQRMAIALKQTGAAGEAAFQAAAASPEYQAWLSSEQKAFGRTLLRPFSHPELSQDVGAWMAGARPPARSAP